MKCIFQQSKYYNTAHTEAIQIAEPLGYNFLHTQKKNKYQYQQDSSLQTNKKLKNQSKFKIKYKYTQDKPVTQTLSTRKNNTYDLDFILQVTPGQRKNILLSTMLLDFLNKQIDRQTYLSIKQIFAPQFYESQQTIHQYQMLCLASLFSNIPKDHLFSIQNYTLSKYFTFFQADNIDQVKYVHNLFNKQLLEYQIDDIYSSPDILKLEENKNLMNFIQPSLDQVQNSLFVEEKIRKINEYGKIKDQFFCGVHFFGGFTTKFTQFSAKTQKKNEDQLKQQIQYLPYLQYYITLMVGILAEGHSALIPLRGTFRIKTNELLFLLKILFQGKITLIKPLGSNIFSNQKYIYCEDFNKSIGQRVKQYLLSNYDVLKQHGQEKLLLNPKQMYKQQFQINLSHFNDTIINKGLKFYFKDYQYSQKLQDNGQDQSFYTKILIYPPRERFIEKMEKQVRYDQKLAEYAKKLIPEQIQAEEAQQRQQGEGNQKHTSEGQNKQKDKGYNRHARNRDKKIQQKQADHQLLNFDFPINTKRPRQKQEKDRPQIQKQKQDHKKHHKEIRQKQGQKKTEQSGEGRFQILRRIQAQKAQKKKAKSKNKQ